MELGLIGPAQSDDLIHFTGRSGSRSKDVPQEIQRMSPSERLDSILAQRKLLAFPPFGVTHPCVCFSECPPDHLAHLIRLRGFSPWGIVVSRSGVLGCDGGAVAYVPDDVYAQFKEQGLEHWAVRTGPNSVWMHEQEWRLPTKGVILTGVRAILVKDAAWRPSLVETDEWVNMETGEPSPGPDGSNPFIQRRKDYPELWRKSPIWVWDDRAQAVVKHAPGTLC
jgi:hypothetical protein